MKFIKLIQKTTIMLLGVLVTTTSCDNWLNLEPENDLIASEFWQNKEDVDAVMAAMYNKYRATSVAYIIWGDLRADIMDIRSIAGLSDYALIAAHQTTVSNKAISWEGYYKTINLANTILESTEVVMERDPDFTAKIKQGYDAEAYFVRALCYFQLVRLWKAVPFIEKATSSDEVELYVANYQKADGKTSYSADEQETLILDHIIKDLELALPMVITDISAGNEKFRGRANKYSIMALLADIYLWKQGDENYKKCIEYCDKIINSGTYRLLNRDGWFNLYYPGNSDESIFEVQYNENYGEKSDIYDDVIPLSGAKGFSPSEKYKEDLYTSNEDIRWFNKYAFGPLRKYNGTSAASSDDRESDQLDANIIYYRYADILLMKAEASAELKIWDESLNALNQILIRAGLNPLSNVNQSINTFRDLILVERAREFAFEGKRWFDILRFAKRNNFEDQTLIRNVLLARATKETEAQLESRVRDPWYFYLPIPDKDIKANHNLEQNPFYDDESILEPLK